MKQLRVILSILTLLLFKQGFSQPCGNMNIQHKADISSTCGQMVMTMIHDVQDRPYLYVANKEGGLKVYEISDITNPVFKKSISTDSFGKLHVMSVHQDGNYLYLALGNSFTNPQSAGMAIINVSDPAQASYVSHYILAGSSSGSGMVKTEGNYAYLAAMGSGLAVFDVSIKDSIRLLSRYVPDRNFPPISNPDTSKINARGMEVKNGIVYLCYDAGGFRIINCTNKSAPAETGRYCNPALYQPFNLPRAYNNIVIDDTLAYIATDYCGMEVLNISDTATVSLHSWWNPYNCPDNNWFTSPVHSNEIQMDKNCGLIFLATGKSDMVVLNVTDPSNPDSCNTYGGVSNNIGTWGAGLYKNQIYLSYICAFGIPFASNWTGVKILTYQPCSTSIAKNPVNEIQVYPQPAENTVYIELKSLQALTEMRIYDNVGRTINLRYSKENNKLILDVSDLPSGIYYTELYFPGRRISFKILK